MGKFTLDQIADGIIKLSAADKGMNTSPFKIISYLSKQPYQRKGNLFEKLCGLVMPGYSVKTCRVHAAKCYRMIIDNMTKMVQALAKRIAEESASSDAVRNDRKPPTPADAFSHFEAETKKLRSTEAPVERQSIEESAEAPSIEAPLQVRTVEASTEASASVPSVDVSAEISIVGAEIEEMTIDEDEAGTEPNDLMYPLTETKIGVNVAVASTNTRQFGMESLERPWQSFEKFEDAAGHQCDIDDHQVQKDSAEPTVLELLSKTIRKPLPSQGSILVSLDRNSNPPMFFDTSPSFSNFSFDDSQEINSGKFENRSGNLSEDDYVTNDGNVQGVPSFVNDDSARCHNLPSPTSWHYGDDGEVTDSEAHNDCSHSVDEEVPTDDVPHEVPKSESSNDSGDTKDKETKTIVIPQKFWAKFWSGKQSLKSGWTDEIVTYFKTVYPCVLSFKYSRCNATSTRRKTFFRAQAKCLHENCSTYTFRVTVPISEPFSDIEVAVTRYSRLGHREGDIARRFIKGEIRARVSEEGKGFTPYKV